MRITPAPRLLPLLSLLLVCVSASSQNPPAQTPPTQTPAPPAAVPDAPQPQTQPPPSKPLSVRPAQTPVEAAEALRISKLPIVNGVRYDQPSTRDTLIDYVHDTYLLSGQARTLARALYGQLHAVYFETTGASSWGTNFPGFMQRFGSSEGITAINGNVRLGMSLLFHEDLRYLPCHGCRAKAKIENALLAEITARHDQTGKRFFTLTPTIADFSGPIIAHSTWYPNFDPMAGVISTRLVFATRIGQHLFQEFVWERRHHDPPFDQDLARPKTPAP